jgi:integrase
MKAVEPIWSSKTETASRLRGRIESVLDWAKVRGHCNGENPARWKGHLDHLLPARATIAKVTHHPALPWEQVGAFMAALGEQDGMAALALQFGILTAARTGEVLGATWREVDIDKALWTVPAARMKGGVEHQVPLSPAALAIVKKLHETRTGDCVFAGRKAAKALSNMALAMLIRRMNEVEEGNTPPWRDPHGEPIVPHGFRSTFRDWCADKGKARDITEASLAHALKDKVEAAYMRTTMFDRRKVLMSEWAAHCSKVVPVGGTVLDFVGARA